MPSVPLALVLCALLALAAPRCGRAQVTPVGTLAELRAALESNAAPHIQLTQHLDLEAEATLSDGPNAPLLAFGPNTRSLRGNCTGAAPGAASLALSPANNQCVVQIAARLFQNTLDASGHRLWLDNLFLVARRRSDDAELRTFLWAAPSDRALDLAARPRLWLTNSVIQGNLQSSVGGVVQNASVYVADTAVVQHRANFAGLIVGGPAAAVALERVEFREITGTGVSSAAMQVLQGGSARLAATTFDAPDTQYDVTTQSGGAVYAADGAAGLRVATGGRGEPGEVLPVSEIDAELAERFVDDQDEEFLAIRREAVGGDEDAAERFGAVVAPPPPPDEGGTDVALVAGICAVIAVAALVATGAIAYWLVRRRRRGIKGAEPVATANGGVAAWPTPPANGSLVTTNLTHTSSAVPTPQALYVSSAAGTPSHRTSRPTQPFTSDINETSLLLSLLRTARPVATDAGTQASLSVRGRLHFAIHRMATAQPPQRFLGRFLVTEEHAEGGQAVVHYARGGASGFFQYAIKFFDRAQDFEIEYAMFADADARSTLPDVFASSDNADGAAAGPRGYVFPPYIVMERGMPLKEWLQADRDALVILAMFKDCAALLARLHAAGRVHRDLKPDNILLMLQTQAWRLIDYGVSARTGTVMAPHCTPAYAPPELIVAMDTGADITVEPSHDVWSLGVIAFEALTRVRIVSCFMGQRGAVSRHARGEDLYPWEATEHSAESYAASAAREVIEACLARDPEDRPSAAALGERMRGIGLVS